MSVEAAQTATAAAAEAVRALNHASLRADEFVDPADVYRLLGELGVMVQRLPQALSQLERILGWQQGTVVMGIDDGAMFDGVDDAVSTSRQHLLSASEDAIGLTEHVRYAQQAISAIYMEGQ